LLVQEGNICINIYGGIRSSPWLSPDSRQYLPFGEKLSPHLRQSSPRERCLTTATAVVNQHIEDTNPFYVENLST
jgi:hypothetical protein